MHSEPPAPRDMTAGDARLHFRDALDSVRAGTPVRISRYGRVEAYLVSRELYEQLTQDNGH